MTEISAVIITHNEAEHIGRCLAALQGIAEETIVVDSGSTDNTEAICRAANAQFVPHAWEGYSAQKNFANSLATKPWILSIDADEVLSGALRDSLMQLKANGLDEATVYSVCRLNNYCGRWLRHGGWRPDEHVRLWHSGTATWEGLVHESLHYSHPVKQQRLAGDLLHYTYSSIADHVQRTTAYGKLAGEKAYEQGRRCGMASVVLKPIGTFLSKYLLKGGFRDGKMGFVAARVLTFYTLVKYARLYEMSRDFRH